MENLELSVLFQLFFGGIVIDFITGVMVAAKLGKLRSRTCSNGMFRSLGEFIVLTIFMTVDSLIPSIHSYLGVFMIGFILKEGLSVCENLIKLDVWIPEFIKKGLEVSIEKADKGEIKAISKK